MNFFNVDRINLSKEDQITKLNTEVRCKLAPSKIHGIGVFAMRDIKKGERCFCSPTLVRKFYNIPWGSMSKLFPEVKQVVLARWPSIINGSAFLNPNDEIWLVSFMNHDDSPNYDILTDIALSDIRKGTELTEDYRIMKNAEIIYPWLAK